MSLQSVQPIQLTRSNNSSTKSNEMIFQLPYPFDSRNNEIALNNGYLFNSVRNITSVYANNIFAYIWNGVSFPVVLADGSYSIADIQGALQTIMFNNGHYLYDNNSQKAVYYISLQVNPIYYSITLTCTPIPSVLPSTYSNPASVTLSGNCPLLTVTSNFNKIIGFAVGNFPSVTQTTIYQINSTLVPQTSPIYQINMVINLVNNPKFSRIPSLIYSFSFNVPSGSQMVLDPKNLIFYRVVDSQYNYISVVFLDQNGNDITLLDPDISLNFLIRSINSNKT